jgi:hypothetical protein
MQLSRRLSLLPLVVLALAWGGAPTSAAAQYKNSSFGLDMAGTFITRPSITDGAGNQLANNQLPLRLAYGERLGMEVNFKLNEDHWWFSGRLNFSLMSFALWGSAAGSPDYLYDKAAQNYIGTELGLQAAPGIRYYFFTDRNRPYLQLSASYMHIFTFSGDAGGACIDPTLCASGGAYADVLLPHTNLLAVHLQPGVEFIVKRDIALHFAVDVQRWLIINAPGNFAFNLVFGVTFYS